MCGGGKEECGERQGGWELGRGEDESKAEKEKKIGYEDEKF